MKRVKDPKPKRFKPFTKPVPRVTESPRHKPLPGQLMFDFMIPTDQLGPEELARRWAWEKES